MYIPVLWWEIFFMTFRRDSWGKYYVQYELSSIFCGSVNSWFFCVCSLFGQGSKAVSPLLLSMGLLPPVRCLKSIPRALRAVTLLWARTPQPSMPCATRTFPAGAAEAAVVAARGDRVCGVQTRGDRVCGVQGEQRCPKRARRAGMLCRDALQEPSQSTGLTTLLFSSTPQKPRAECVSTRASHHREK